MCGIVGAYGRVDEETLSLMLEWIEHRGPDDEGRYIDRDAGVMLGARRLAIVDLEGGSQPKWNEDETVGVVFNGEIYNHDELRGSLQQDGHRFESQSDTEVLVHLWEAYGHRMVDHLEGMFAFSIWDAESETIFLARDRMGIKPLYYGRTDTGYVWGSELPALLIGGVNRSIDPAAVFNHFSLEYAPGSQTLLRDVRKVKPGHTVEIGPDGVREREYWSFLDVETGSATTSFADAADRLSTLLERSVEQRLMADVPVGAFLSGGLDSSAIVGIASNLRDEPLDTYSVAFSDERFDESAEARLVADHFGTNHHEVHVDLSSMDVFDDMIRHLGEPTGHLQMLPLFLLSQRAREDVKVALAGEGADELFAGYSRYQQAPQYKRKVDFLPKFTHDVAGAVATVAPVGSKHLQYYSWLKDNTELVLHNTCGFMPFRPEPDDFLTTGETAETSGLRSSVSQVTSRVEDPTPEQHISAFETSQTLPNFHLFKADHTSMAQSLELRVPFLSADIVEFAHSLPIEYKATDQDVKRVLKRAVGDLLPREILEREKMGMRPPVEDWFRGDHDAIERWFDRGRLERTPYVDADRAAGLRDRHRRGEESVGRTLWLILTYVAWYHTFIDEETAIV
ncbi:asparagine synthase (glutamine-hydrolyzing) [Natronosalvus rutilus]|uniref:Putative asparagine synthetase [glutamine-hydrolyzing] n=1 Tax=Natronosalvus rutilus TaxID=2953753 RepID=A0A9E7NBT1_9EURY|nr:asparagine synthase (glutamine-hydrolyzing) [Natronosalvus rutilus]UTF54094.1 asparagine synthase (glutamine-hydrolyzing) [Natronosalvus rutilus]